MMHSPWIAIEGARHNCNAAAHRRKGRLAVETTTSEKRQAIQVFHRSFTFHHRA